MTNGDRIRYMTNEELEDFLISEMWHDFKPSCKKSKFFSAENRPDCISCYGCVMDWIMKESES